MVTRQRRPAASFGAQTGAGRFASDMAWAAAFCPVCFGASDSPMAQAMNWGVLSLLAITVVVLATCGGFFVRLAKRARAAAAQEVQS